MECDICTRTPPETNEFLCTACARNIVYLSRFEYAQALIAKDVHYRKVQDAISHHTGDSQDTRNIIDQKIFETEITQFQINEIKERVKAFAQARELLTSEMQDLNKQIQIQKSNIVEKREMLITVRDGIPARQQSFRTDAVNANSKVQASLTRLQQLSADARAKLSREVASLMRLRKRRSQREPPTREQFSIAGLTLPDLREISTVAIHSYLGSLNFISPAPCYDIRVAQLGAHAKVEKECSIGQ